MAVPLFLRCMYIVDFFHHFFHYNYNQISKINDFLQKIVATFEIRINCSVALVVFSNRYHYLEYDYVIRHDHYIIVTIIINIIW